MMSQSWIQWIPGFSTNAMVGLLLLSVAVALCVRVFWGQGFIGRNWPLWFLRGGSMVIVAIILLGPTWVEQSAPILQRPKMLFLFDGSSSMKLGAGSSRWQDALDFVSQGVNAAAPDARTDCQNFRFGHRLSPLAPDSNTSVDTRELSKVSFTPAGISAIPSSIGVHDSQTLPPPEATDTRLADALRELSSRMDTRNTAGLVLISDGRVRGSESVEQLSTLLGRRNIPIHVVPVGSATGTGDVAIISMVTQPSVRKFTENEVQVFLRSFGMAGKNTTVRIVDADSPPSSPPELVASVPIVLTGNAQSVSLIYNIADQPRNFRIMVDPIEGELTTRNNEINVKVGIDRTRVRILYIEGNANGRVGIAQILGNSLGLSTPTSNQGFTVSSALREDPDIECSAYESSGGRTPPQSVLDPGMTVVKAFPESRSELFSYDCIIFSNVGPDVLEPDQQEMIAQWIEGRGAGMIVTGPEAIQKQRWVDSPLSKALPVDNDSMGDGADQMKQLKLQNRLHPIWKLLNESVANDRLLSTLPSLLVRTTGLKLKPGADVLATSSDSNEPMIVSQRYGRGRVLFAVPALGGSAGDSLHNNWGPQGKRSASKIWKNMVYWATEGSSIGRRRVTVEPDKRFYRPGDSMTFRAIAYNEDARRTTNYSLWGMFEPLSMDDSSMFAPAMWPEGIRRESGETSPRIAWGEEIPLQSQAASESYGLTLNLNEVSDGTQGGLRMELTAYEIDGSVTSKTASTAMGHGTQVDSMSLEVHILSDPFEQQNPLPNHDLLHRVANLSGGNILSTPAELAKLLESRPTLELQSAQSTEPAWSHWWLWSLLGLFITSEWMVRRLSGLA